jgi:hypothetical protein
MIKRIIILLEVLSKMSDFLHMLKWSNRSYFIRYTIILVTSRDCNHISWFRNSAFVSLLATINTSFNDFVSMIFLILSSLKRRFELRYRLNSFDSLSLLIMKCIQNVTNSQCALKIRSYKKNMNDLNRDEWLKIMKNENNSFLINKIWISTNSFKNKRVLRDKCVYKIKKKRHDEILRYKTRWMICDFEQIEKLNYIKTFISMIKSMNYKTMYIMIVVND